MTKVMSGHAICMSKIETCMKCMSKRLMLPHAGGCLRQRGGFNVSASRHPPRPLGGLEAQRLRVQEVRNDIRQEACRSIIQELKIKEIHESKDAWKNKAKARKDSRY